MTSSVSSCSSLMVGESVVINSSSWPVGPGRVGVILVENIDGGFVETAESGDSSASDTRSGAGVSERVVLSSKGMEVAELMVVVRISRTDMSTKDVWLMIDHSARENYFYSFTLWNHTFLFCLNTALVIMCNILNIFLLRRKGTQSVV